MKFAFTLLISALSFLTISAEFVKPEDIEPDATYALTLSTDASKVLISHHGRPSVETFDPKDAEDVGSDNGRRWKFKENDQTHISSELRYVIYSVRGGKDGGYFDEFSTQGGWEFSTTRKKPPSNLVIFSRNGGIKIGLGSQSSNYTHWLGPDPTRVTWYTVDDAPAAIWMITKFVVSHLEMFSQTFNIP